MAHLNELATALLDEVGPNRSAAGVVMSSRWRAPDDGKVYPPTFPVDGPSRYLYEKRHVPGESEPREVVVLDQPASQANRVEAALLEARDEGRIRLPLFVLRASTTDGERRLTSLEFPHRFADAYLRDSELDGVLFAKTTPGARLRETTSNDVRPLFERSPESLVFGSWDSHRKGRSVKFPRVFSSSMIGWDPQIGQRAGGKMDPFNLTGAVKDSAVTEGDWEFSATGEAKKKGAKLSELGHSNIALPWTTGASPSPGLTGPGGCRCRGCSGCGSATPHARRRGWRERHWRPWPWPGTGSRSTTPQCGCGPDATWCAPPTPSGSNAPPAK